MNVVQRAEKDIKVHIRNCESPFQIQDDTVLATRFESPFQYPGYYTRKRIQGERGSLIKTFVKY